MIYKVATQIGDNEFCSSVCYGKWMLMYSIGHTTTNKNGIFCFTSLMEAVDYMMYLDGAMYTPPPIYDGKRVVLEVDEKECWIPNKICTSYDDEALDAYYTGDEQALKYLEVDSPWRSLMLAKSIKPTRIINIHGG